MGKPRGGGPSLADHRSGTVEQLASHRKCCETGQCCSGCPRRSWRQIAEQDVLSVPSSAFPSLPRHFVSSSWWAASGRDPVGPWWTLQRMAADWQHASDVAVRLLGQRCRSARPGRYLVVLRWESWTVPSGQSSRPNCVDFRCCSASNPCHITPAKRCPRVWRRWASVPESDTWLFSKQTLQIHFQIINDNNL